MAATSNLPPEIIETILLNLLVKSLLRFKTVSKSWNTTISDPVFVENHLQKSKESNSHNLFLRRSNSSSSIRFSAVKLEDKKFQTLGVLTESPPFECGSVLCFCDGILLLTDVPYRRLVLWNPSTRTAEKLWNKDCCCYASFGLCRDPNTGDFKVVVLDRQHYSVYSCMNKSWITLRKKHDGLGLTITNPSGLCVNGASYWVMCSVTTKIRYFDPRDDKFKMLDKPDQIDDIVAFLVNLRGSLCLYCYFEGVEKNTVRIWEKENGIDNSSWKELVTVEYDYVSVFSGFEPLCFIQNKIVFREGRRLVIYNPCDKSFEAFEKDMPVWEIAVAPVKYMETLYFPIEKSKSKPNRKRKCLQ